MINFKESVKRIVIVKLAWNVDNKIVLQDLGRKMRLITIVVGKVHQKNALKKEIMQAMILIGNWSMI